MNFKASMGKYLPWALLLLTLPLFFYRLGEFSLVNWDEAWYAEIARNILKSGDWLHLTFNQRPYTDHGPTGFWLMAISFSLLGVSEFAARFPSALLGFLGLVFTYLLGKELFKSSLVGLLSAFALASAPWYLYRARSGNLDVTLTFFFILSIYLAIKATQNRRFFVPLSISLVLLMLTKTIVPLTIIPALVVIFAQKKVLKSKELWLSLGAAGLLIWAWFTDQAAYKSDFVARYFMIGLPGVDAKTDYQANLKLVKEYIHSGIGKWFWPGVIGVVVGPLLLQRRFLILSAFCLAFFLPFLSSSKGHIWHLIPLYPFMILSFVGLFYILGELALRTFKVNKIILPLLMIAVCGFYGGRQLRQDWYQFIDIPAFVTDQAILSREAAKYPGILYIDGEDFGPVAVFYSGGKEVIQVWEGGLPELFTKPQLVLITYQWRLDKFNIPTDQYRIIKADRDKILVVKE